MNSTAMTLEEIRQRRLQALSENLGAVELIRFIQQFETGYGDHTVERSRWLDERSVQQLAQEIARQRKTENGSL
jgi:hypothetical protein